ncbi:hypothetical protein Droror1_Dr00008381, partial [Drosera rotundifolia]
MQTQSTTATHIKWTSVRQESGSSYKLVETQDLHSRVVLDHPRGYSRQLHKCIVVHSQGQAVFDGNVRVN